MSYCPMYQSYMKNSTGFGVIIVCQIPENICAWCGES